MQEKETDSVKLAVLEEKVFNMLEVISKLDDTIEKLSDLSTNVSKMLAVHEEKLEVARDSAAETAKEIVLLETRMDEKMRSVKDRLRAVERRVWIGIGIVLTVTMLQSEIVTGALFKPQSPAIMEIQPK